MKEAVFLFLLKMCADLFILNVILLFVTFVTNCMHQIGALKYKDFFFFQMSSTDNVSW